METDTEGGFYFSVDAPWCKFVTNLLMMKQANMRCELPKVKSSDMLFFHGFPFAVKAVKQAALQIGRSFHWPLLSSVTAVDSPIMTVCQHVFLLHKTLSCQRWLEHTYLLKTTLNTALTRHYRGLWEYEFPVTEGYRGWTGGAWQQAIQIWDLRLTGKTIATRGVGPEAQRPRSKPESILLSAFLYPPFAPLLLRFSVLTGEQRVRGTFPGAASFTAHGPKRSRAKHKGSGHCHSPQSPTIMKATFQSKMPPSLPHPAPPPADRDGSEWATMGYLQWEEPCFYLSDSQDVEHERRISSARPAGWIPEHFEMFRTQECHIFNIVNR